MTRWKNIGMKSEIKGVRKCIVPNLQETKSKSVGGVGMGGLKVKVTENGLKHILVLEFLKSDQIYEIL